MVKVSSPACVLATITTGHAKYDGTIDHKPADSLLPFSAECRRMEGVTHLQFLYAVMACAEKSFVFDFAHSLPAHTHAHTHTHTYIYITHTHTHIYIYVYRVIKNDYRGFNNLPYTIHFR